MRYAIVLLTSLLLADAAKAEETQGNITGPQAAPRVPEAATDVPIRAPGPATGSPTAAGPSTGSVQPPAAVGTKAAPVVIEPPPRAGTDERP